MTSEPIRFLEGFEAPTFDAWRDLAAKALKGAPLEKLTTKTLDGLAIKPLYTAADRPATAETSNGFSDDTAGTWDICQPIAHPDPATANKTLLDELARGASGAVLRIATSSPSTDGLSIATLSDFLTLLKGVHPDIDRLHICAGTLAPAVAAMMLAVAAETEMPISALEARLHIDPFGALAGGKTALPPDVANAVLIAFAKAAGGTDNHLRAIGVDTTPYHNAGASEAQEIAVALATGAAYLRTLTSAGLSADDAGKITFTFAADADFFLTIAKLRAFRRAWEQIAAAVFPGTSGRAYEVHVVTSERMMTRRDMTVNILRTTCAAFAAAVGGANAITVLPFTHRDGLPAELARRIARNTQIILEQESHVAQVADPVSGSYALETLTDDLARAAWNLFQEIEADGGMGAALVSGAIQKRIADKADARRKAIAARKIAITGISEFPALDERTFETVSADPSVVRVRSEKAETTAAADVAVATALKAIDPAHPDGLVEAMVNAARTGATLRQIMTRLGAGATTVSPLTPHMLDEDFEALRARSDRHLVQSGARPKVFLVPIGTLADFTARVTFARAFFEAGGIETVVAEGFAKPADAAAAFVDAGAPLAALCSSDALYAEHGAAFAHAVKGAGARALYYAGRPGGLEATLQAAGIDEFIYVGANVAATLQRAYDVIGGVK